MSRIHTRLNSLRGSRRKALVAFITGGDPNKATTAPAMRALVAGGADVIEVGMPFSDPEAEGPAVQKSSERALAAGTRLADILDVVTEFRAQDTTTPVLLMGYLNSIERMGYREFVNRAATAGVDGMILVNLPPEEAGELRDLMRARGLELIGDRRLRLRDLGARRPRLLALVVVEARGRRRRGRVERLAARDEDAVGLDHHLEGLGAEAGKRRRRRRRRQRPVQAVAVRASKATTPRQTPDRVQRVFVVIIGVFLSIHGCKVES